MKSKRWTRAWLLLLASGCALNADVVLAPVFSDNAVLQRDSLVPVWGSADPGEKVSVSFNGQTKQTTADAQGKWLVALDKMPANAKGLQLTVKGNNTIAFDNVVVGDVWLCGGQSNMAWLVERTNNAKEEIANSTNPLIRHNAAARAASSTPQSMVEMTGWQEASPQTTGKFTATGYYMARELQKALDVPIGLLNISYGGTMIEAWMSAQAIANTPQGAAVENRWQAHLADWPQAQARYAKAKADWEKKRDEAKQAGKPFNARPPRAPEGKGSRVEPASLYNAMLYPSIPYAICGIIWYQGEANASRHTEYADLAQGLVKQWRAEFGQGDVPFYYVELANLYRSPKVDPTGREWAYQREAQRGALREPNTGVAVAIDIGTSNDIHPQNKQEVGRRLALNALALKYGKALEYAGPLVKDVAFGGGVARVQFSHADGLALKPGKASGFEVAGADKVFHPAQAVVKGDTVVVSASAVKAPVAVRYLFENDPASVTLYNASGLPALAFRSDNWPNVKP